MKVESVEEFVKRGGVIQKLDPRESKKFENFLRDYFIKRSLKITALRKAKREILK